MTSAVPMGMRRRTFRILVALAAWVAPLPAATLERLSLDDVIQKSTAIVRGRVLGSQAAFRGSVIYTHWKVQVLERWKGTDEATVEVLVPGGSASGFRQTVAGAPQLSAGKEYLLFLWTAPSGATYITGLTQGVFDLPKNAADELMASRKATGETMLERGTWRVVKDEPIEMRFADMSARITATLAQGAGR